MSRIFISYRREDSADVVGRIYDHLVIRFGTDAVFKDVESIPLGEDFRKAISKAISMCDTLLVVIGQKWLGSLTAAGTRRIDQANDFVRIEVENAFARGLRIIPILVQGSTIPTADILPATLRDLQFLNAISVRSDPDFSGDIARLVEVLKTQDDKQTASATSTTDRCTRNDITAPGRRPGCSLTLSIALSIFLLVFASGRWTVKYFSNEATQIAGEEEGPFRTDDDDLDRSEAPTDEETRSSDFGQVISVKSTSWRYRRPLSFPSWPSSLSSTDFESHPTQVLQLRVTTINCPLY